MRRAVFICISVFLRLVLLGIHSGKIIVFYLFNKKQKLIAQSSMAEEEGAYQLLHFLRTNPLGVEERAGLIKEILRKKKQADALKSELNSEGKKELLRSNRSRLLDQNPYFVKAGEQIALSNIPTGNEASYIKALLKHIQINIGQVLRHSFNFVFMILVIPFYYLIFFPIAKLTLMFEKRAK